MFHIYSKFKLLSVENEFVREQITTGIPCDTDSTLCADRIGGSVCHPLNFCYCPDGTVLEDVSSGGESQQQCVPGEGISASIYYRYIVLVYTIDI